MTLPSLFNAAKANLLEKIWLTPVNPAGAAGNSAYFDPSHLLLPQLMTLPSLFNAAKAPSLENIWLTPVNPAGALPPYLLSPQAITLPLLFNAAKAYSLPTFPMLLDG